jgi:hypothetical protein
MSDIVFNTRDEIEVLCSNLNVRGTDFVIDSPVRRKPNGPRLRRALVHDESDGLSINFGNDYPGGVTMGGVRVLDVTGELTFKISHIGELSSSGGPAPNERVILSELIKELRRQIFDLQLQINKLAARP